MTENNIWYAIMKDNDDADWGTGSYDLADAERKVREYRENGNDDAYIAVIEMGNDPICIDEIREF